MESLLFAHQDPLKRWERIAFVALLVVGLLILGHGMGQFFLEGHEGWSGCRRSNISMNFIDYGWETGFAQIDESGPLEEPHKARTYWHHPAVYHFMLVIPLWLFGAQEWAIRLLPVLCAVLTWWSLAACVRRRYGGATACATLGVWMTFPMFVAFGRLPNFETMVIALVMLCIELMERARYLNDEDRRGRALHAVGAAVLTALMCGVDWPAYMFAFFLGVDALWRKPRRPELFLTIGVVSAASLAFWLWWLPPETTHETWSGVKEWRDNATWWRFIEVIADRCWRLYGPLPVIATVGILVVSIARRAVGPLSVITILGSAIYYSSFKQATVVHNYYLLYMMPVFALGGARAVVWIGEHLKARLHAILPVMALLAGVHLWWVVPHAQEIYWKSRAVRPERVNLSPKKYPQYSQLYSIVLGKFIAETTPADAVFYFHRSHKPPRHLRYYADRRMHWGLRGPPAGQKEGYFVAREARVSKELERKWATRFALTRIAGWLVYDLSEPGIQITTYYVRPQPASWWHMYWESITYPPYELERNEASIWYTTHIFGDSRFNRGVTASEKGRQREDKPN